MKKLFYNQKELNIFLNKISNLGELLKSYHIKICRPLGSGFEPKYFSKILGKKIRHSINQDDNFKKSDFYR